MLDWLPTAGRRRYPWSPLIQPLPSGFLPARFSYAALILKDDGVEVTGEAITAILKAAGIDVGAEAYYPGIFAKALANHDIAALTVVGGGGGGGGGGAAAPAGGDAAPAAEAAKEEEKEESEEEDMGFGLFD